MPFFVPQKVFLSELNLRKIGTGFFGGEGFIMQKLEGDGLAFMHAGGTVYKRELKPVRNFALIQVVSLL